MLTIEQCRRILGTRCQLTDPEIEALRDAMYNLADVAVDAFLERQRETTIDARDGDLLPSGDRAPLMITKPEPAVTP